MKKISLSLAALAVIALAACSNEQTEHETTGAIPAKIVNDNVTEITVTEDSALSAEDAVSDDLENLKEDTKDMVSDKMDEATEEAEELKEQAAEKIREKKEAAKEVAAEKLEEAAHALED